MIYTSYPANAEPDSSFCIHPEENLMLNIAIDF